MWAAASALTRALRSLDMAERHDWRSMHFEQHCSDAVLTASTLLQQGSCQGVVKSRMILEGKPCICGRCWWAARCSKQVPR